MSKSAGGITLFCTTLVMLLAISALTVHAAILTVDTTADEFGDGTDCSLREAIRAANINSDFDGCVGAGSYGTDTIALDAATYTLTITGEGEDANATGDLDITSNMTIQGQGADMTTVDGNGIDRVFDIAVGNIVIINDITITGGEIDGNGGGIQNLSSLTLDGVAVDNNTAFNAGGILNGKGGILTIQNSTISNNTATNDAGGIQNSIGSALGGSTLEIINSTISGNTAASDAGGINNRATLALNNVTITDNTATSDRAGGIFQHASVSIELSNTILAGNTAGISGPDCFTQVGAELTSLGFNLVGNNADCTFIDVAGDQIGTDLSPIDPMLGPLQNNGGTTETHLPEEDSPAVDMGSDDVINGAVEPSQAGNGPACEPTDQRGEPRPAGFNDDGNAVCDIGSVEKQTDDTGSDGDGGTGNCSITGENIKVSSVSANVLISLIPAFVIGFRMLRRRTGKDNK